MDAVELLSHERTGGLMQELQSAVEEHVAEKRATCSSGCAIACKGGR